MATGVDVTRAETRLAQERVGLAQAETAAEQARLNLQRVGAISGMVARQAMVLSYIDNFRVLAFLCLLCVPAVFLFKRVKRKGPVAMH